MNASFWLVGNRGRAPLLILLLVVAFQVAACGSSLPISTTPSFVLGQTDFTTGMPGTSQTQVNTPESIAIDSQGGLYVADTNNNRVLHFPASCLSNRTNGCAADFVLGQPNFTTGVSGTSQTQLNSPESVTPDGRDGLYVADTNNNRVLHFPASCLSNRTNGCAADFVLGQPDFISNGFFGPGQTGLWGPESVTPDGRDGLYVADTNNSRVLHFPASCLSNRTNGCAADFVLGQPDFISNGFGTSQTRLNAPASVAIDGQSGLYVADLGNNRVLHFPASCLSNRTNGCAADFVLGQPNFTSNSYGWSQTQLNTPESIAFNSGGLYVADGPNRVLHFPASCLSNRTNGCAADFVLGQPDFISNGFGTSQTQLNAPASVAIDGQSGLYVADMSNNRIVYFPPSGS